MKVSYRQSALDDVIRQFRYYLVECDLPEVAIRFRESVRRTIAFFAATSSGWRALWRRPGAIPRIAPSWPVTGFEALRIFYLRTTRFSRLSVFCTASVISSAFWNASAIHRKAFRAILRKGGTADLGFLLIHSDRRLQSF